MRRKLIWLVLVSVAHLSTGLLPTLAVVVTNTNDSGPGSLRESLLGNDGVIEFAPFFGNSPHTVFLNSSLPTINRDLSIIGPGADLLTVDGQFRVNSDALINIFSFSPVVRLQGFTLKGGSDPLSTSNVGGIFSRGRLTLADFALDDNRGTGVFNQAGTLEIVNSTISSNSGEGVFNQLGTLEIVNSTISSNSGDGIINQSGTLEIVNSTIALNGFSGVTSHHGHITVRNSTIAGNSATGLLSSIDVTTPRGSLDIESTILADNHSGDLSFNAINSIRSSLVEAGFGVEQGTNGNIVGVDPLLGALSDNGGGTRTMLPQPGSPAINAGSNPLSLQRDQRGFTRLEAGAVDMGSVETVPEPGVPGWVSRAGSLKFRLSFVFPVCHRVSRGGVTIL